MVFDISLSVPDPDLKIRGGGGGVGGHPVPEIRGAVLGTSVWSKNKRRGQAPLAPPLDPPLSLFDFIFLDSCVQVKEREGNSTEAVNLYLKAGLPAKAARLAMSREVYPYVDQIYSHPPLFSSDSVSFETYLPSCPRYIGDFKASSETGSELYRTTVLDCFGHDIASFIGSCVLA